MLINFDKLIRDNRSFGIEKITPEMNVTEWLSIVFSDINRKYFTLLEHGDCGSLNQVHRKPHGYIGN